MPKEYDSLGSADTVFGVDKNVVPDLSSILPGDWSVLAFVDGTRSVAEICSIVPMVDDEVVGALRKFKSLGMIVADAAAAKPSASASPPPKPARPRARPRRSPSASTVPRVEADAAEAHGSTDRRTPPRAPNRSVAASSSSSSTHKPPKAKSPSPKGVTIPDGWPIAYDQFMFDPTLLSEGLDISIDKQKQIIYYQYHLKRVSYYDLFQIDSDMPARKLKTFYFRLSKQFHPDKYFRKELGAYKDRIEEVFKWISQAYATLNDPRKRAQYDAILSSGLLGEWQIEARPRKKAAAASPMHAAARTPSGTRLSHSPQNTVSGTLSKGHPGASGKSRARKSKIVERQRGAGTGSSPSTPRGRVSSRTMGAVTERVRHQKGGLVAKAEAAEAAGDWDRAATHYIASLAVRFLPAAAHSAAQCLLAADKRYDEAESLCRKVLSVDQHDALRASTLTTLGRVLIKQNRAAEAKAALTEAHKLAPSDETIAIYLDQLPSSE